MFFNQNRKTAKCLKNKKCYVVLIILCTLCFFFSRCIHRNIRNSEGTTVSFSQYAGSEKCATCHKAIYNSFLLTGHHLTSLVSDSTDIKGSFTPGENVFHYTANLLVEMENSDSGLYQVEYQNGKEVLARKFDITIGSGMRGQTYLSWNADILTQLPVSYLTSANSWANSPGDKDQVYFDRPVNSRCLECHATFAKVLPFRFMNGPEEFDRHNVILTISCEKCHGPGAKHVNWQTENPEARIAKYIINPSQFSRQQSLDMCAVCHGGQIKSTKPTFSYVPGKKLTGYFKIGSPNDTSIDVHGNQLGLLKQSKCFRMTSTLTCLSCHNPHSDERNNLALFSAKCMRCHRVNLGTFCSVKNVPTNILRQNCIDCHMPKQVSKSIVLQVEDKQKPTAQLLRTHFIKVYGGATKKFFSQMAQNQK